MTTVAWDGKTLAADRSGTIGDVSSKVCKIFYLKNGGTFAGIGTLPAVRKFAKFLDMDSPPLCDWASYDEDLRVSSIAGIFVDKDRTAFIAYYNGDMMQIPSGDYMALGSGAALAMGALGAGADAKRAVEIACMHDPWTGFGVDVG